MPAEISDKIEQHVMTAGVVPAVNDFIGGIEFG